MAEGPRFWHRSLVAVAFFTADERTRMPRRGSAFKALAIAVAVTATVAFLAIPFADGFSVPSLSTSHTGKRNEQRRSSTLRRLPRPHLSSKDDEPGEMKSNTVLERYGIDGLGEYINQVRENTSIGELGQRGEEYFVAQAAIFACILFGTVPVIGDFLFAVAGPGLFVAGGAAIAAAVNEMGPLLSPWPTASDGTSTDSSSLVKTGIFASVRHPIYAGLLCVAAGISVMTGSAPRLILTAVLYVCLDLKSDFEEKSLVEKVAGYEDYRQEVKGKFIPHSFVEALRGGE